MFTRCAGWAALHVPPIIMTPDDNGDGRQSDGICPACDAVLLLLDAPRSPRLTRFIARATADRLTPRVRSSPMRLRYPGGAIDTLHLEKLR